jgi:hypothetical protein
MAKSKKKASSKKSVLKKKVSSKKPALKKKVSLKKSATKKAIGKKSDDQEYKALYQKIYRRKKLKQEISKSKKKGWKAKRSKVYKEIVGLNKEIMALCKRKKYKIPESIKLRKKAVKQAKKGETKYFPKEGRKIKCANIWEFEEVLAGFLKEKKFKTIFMKDVNKKFNKSTPPSTVLYWYDKARDKAYEYQFAGTPQVCYEEDTKKSILTIEITS